MALRRKAGKAGHALTAGADSWACPGASNASTKAGKKQPKSAPVKKGRGRPKKPRDMSVRAAGIPGRLIDAILNMPGVKMEDIQYLSQISRYSAKEAAKRVTKKTIAVVPVELSYKVGDGL